MKYYEENVQEKRRELFYSMAFFGTIGAGVAFTCLHSVQQPVLLIAPVTVALAIGLVGIIGYRYTSKQLGYTL